MATIESTVPAQRISEPDLALSAPPAGLRPVAHWVQMPGDDGRSRLTMVWTVPDPLPSTP